MDLVMARGHFRRDRGGFVPWRQVNCLLEETKTDPKGYNLLSRPPLAGQYSWGAGPIHGIFYKVGLFGGAVFVISNTTLYKDGVSLGTINGTGPVSWAGGNSELVVTRGQSAYSYNGTNLAAIAFPDSADVRAVNWMSGYFVFVRKSSGRYYWSDLNDGRTVGGLSYATAESEQDELLDIKKTGDVFWMLGANTGEAWVLNGDPVAPWSRVVQRTIMRGVQDTGCAEEIEGTVFFISSDGMLCTIAQDAVRISDSSMEERIRESTGGSTFHFQYEGKVLFCVRLDSGTFALDLALQNQPIELTTYGRTHWAPKCAAQVGSEVLFGDDTAGTVWIFDPDAETDSGETIFERIFTAGAPSSRITISNVLVDGDKGDTEAIASPANDPLLEMRPSRDGGRTFGVWRSTKWGAAGEFGRKARFGGCGRYGPPGFLAEFRMQACAPLRVANIRANESCAGRGW